MRDSNGFESCRVSKLDPLWRFEYGTSRPSGHRRQAWTRTTCSLTTAAGLTTVNMRMIVETTLSCSHVAYFFVSICSRNLFCSLCLKHNPSCVARKILGPLKSYLDLKYGIVIKRKMKCRDSRQDAKMSGAKT